MNIDVFISHSSKDASVANAICNTLEENNIKCWMSPRDIDPGTDWADAICNAIRRTSVMVVIFSKDSNSSVQVPKELSLALNNKVTIIPFKIDNTEPTGSMEYYLADTHWLMATTGDSETNICILKDAVVLSLPCSKKLNILRPAGDL